MRRKRFISTGRNAAIFFLLAAGVTGLDGASYPSAFKPAAQKANQMKIDTTNAQGTLVSVAFSITNIRPVGLIYARMTYNPTFLSFQGATPALRVADWPFFDNDADTLVGEIHIVGLANDSFPLQPGSGPVGYLNFQIIDQTVPPGTFVPISFTFRDSTDNTMYDSAGAKIDTSQIAYVNGGIFLTPTSVTDQNGNRPQSFELGQNYPNPFNPSTSFTLSLPKAGRYSVRIYNVAGQVVKTFEGEAAAGRQTFTWNGTDERGRPVSSGVYFYQAQAGDFASTKKMLLLK